jgi:hypothetical protein
VSGQNSEGFAAPQYGWQACVKGKNEGPGHPGASQASIDELLSKN